jgi:hypothetical protein
MHGMYGLVVMLILTYVGVAIGAMNTGTLFTWWVCGTAAVPAQVPVEQAPRRVA